jgi:hypothetical protein
MRPFLDQTGAERMVPTGRDPQSLLADYGWSGPDDVTLMLAARVEKAGSG